MQLAPLSNEHTFSRKQYPMLCMCCCFWKICYWSHPRRNWLHNSSAPVNGCSTESSRQSAQKQWDWRAPSFYDPTEPSCERRSRKRQSPFIPDSRQPPLLQFALELWWFGVEHSCGKLMEINSKKKQYPRQTYLLYMKSAPKGHLQCNEIQAHFLLFPSTWTSQE